ncbi:MAG: hypothetical protein Q9218_000984 [Villophora microphyllina]
MDRPMSLKIKPDASPSSDPRLPSPRLKPSVPANIPIQSFAAFQANTPQVNGHSPVRRKPLPSSASIYSPKVPPLSTGGKIIAVGEEDPDDHSTSSPFSQSFARFPWKTAPASNSPPLVVRDLDHFPRGHSPQNAEPPRNPLASAATDRPSLSVSNQNVSIDNRRLASESMLHEGSRTNNGINGTNNSVQRTMSLSTSARPSALHINGDRDSNYESNDPATIVKTPRSPGPSKLASFFGLRGSSPIAEQSPTSKSHSPGLSPLLPSPRTTDASRYANGANSSYFADAGFPLPPGAPAMSVQVADMEEELRDISAELAGSIRRELELEDIVDRLQYEAQQGPELGRRTSDYFSDSGTSSIRYPPSDVNVYKAEDHAKMKRASEQEKARYKLDMSQKLQDERGRRKALELHIQQLASQAQHMDQERAAASSAANRVRDLENTLEDLRRRLKDEKRGKSNFEDLLTALRDEIEQHRNEKENLRDEIVPQLQARVDSFETEAAQSEKLIYENTRMHQELQSLRDENTALSGARRPQLEMQQQPSRFTSIAEEDGPGLEAVPSAPKVGLTRSNSTARNAGMTGAGLSRAGSLTRSNSVSAKERESRESLADRVKDIEMQRDALHRALKGLLERQSYQEREHSKKLKALEAERDRALEAESPRRAGYEKEVTGLRFEINQLRRRADEALVQKWQCEKGLGGLKMDLDRAEQETTSLRTLLQEHDILIPEVPRRTSQDGRSSQDNQPGAHATSATLERAYQELQATQALSVEKLRELWGEAPTSGEDAETAQRMDMLLQTVNGAEAERDYAQKQAQIYRAKIESLQEAESFASGESAGLADELKASAKRAGSLAAQVRLQLQSNGSLRERLADAVGKGEAAQKSSADRINNMQAKLKALEDKLMNAQQHSEEAFARHEEEVRQMRDNHNQQLHRLKGGLRTPTMYSPKAPLSPLFSARSPRLDKTTSGQGMSMNEALRTESLEKRVAELEAALGDADKEMEEVVSRMNLAQIEVMELQSARDEAMRQTRKLQAAIIAEREKVDSLMK